MADGEGFEPPKVLFHTLSDFKSDAFNRSANHPYRFCHHRLFCSFLVISRNYVRADFDFTAGLAQY